LLKLNAAIVDADLHYEVLTQKMQQFFSLDIRIETISLAGEDEQSPEEIY
jgi:hypothetical protein